MTRTIVMTTASVLLIAAAASGQGSVLRFGVHIGAYFGEEYTRLPIGGSFVFFTGEPIELLLAVANTDNHTVHELVTSTVDPSSGFVLKGLRDQQPIEIAMSVVSQGQLYDGPTVRPIDWDGRIALNPLAHIEWRAVVTNRTLPPGVYVLEMSPLMFDERLRPISVVNDFAFEVRARSPESEPEILRRRGYRELAGGQHDTAERTARELLALYSGSSQAHILLGNVADARRNEYIASGDSARARESLEQAMANYRRALTLLEAGDDQLLLTSGATASAHAIESLRRRVRDESP